VAESVISDVSGNYGIQVNIVKQSPEISRGVDVGGAGDQGIMIGYATNETKDMIPLELSLARSLAKYLYKKYSVDGKTQVTLLDNKINSIVASFQNTKNKVLKKDIEK
jgi:S-adenosylmethionine synthetase